jgi:hypothetical protein
LRTQRRTCGMPSISIAQAVSSASISGFSSPGNG